MCWLWKEPLWSQRFEQYTLFGPQDSSTTCSSTTALFRANTSPDRDLHMVVPASLLVLTVTSYHPHHAKLQTSIKNIRFDSFLSQTSVHFEAAAVWPLVLFCKHVMWLVTSSITSHLHPQSDVQYNGVHTWCFTEHTGVIFRAATSIHTTATAVLTNWAAFRLFVKKKIKNK